MNQPISAEVDATNASRISFSHPEPERDLGASSSRRHSFSHGGDDDGCYRPEPSTSRLDANLLTPYQPEVLMRSVYQFGAPLESGTLPDFGQRRPTGLGSGSRFLDWANISRGMSEQPDSMPTQEETIEEDAPTVEVRAQR